MGSILIPSLLLEVIAPALARTGRRGLPHPWGLDDPPFLPAPCLSTHFPSSHTLPASPGHYLITTYTLKLFRGDSFPDSPLVRHPHPFCVQRIEAGARKGSSLSNTLHTLNHHSPGARPPNSLVVLGLPADFRELLSFRLAKSLLSLVAPYGHYTVPDYTGVLEKVPGLVCSLRNYFSVFPSHLYLW